MNNFFSVWKIKSFSDIEDLKINLDKNRTHKDELKWNDDPLLSKIETSKIETLKIKDKDIKYVYLDLIVERKKNEDHWYETDTEAETEELVPRYQRINLYEADAFIFEADNELKLIIFKGVTTANIIKNTLFKLWCELELITYFEDDLFFWLYWHYDTKKEDSLRENSDIFIDSLLTYTGTSQDEKNEIKVDGERVPALLATLGNIFSSKSFKHLKLDLYYMGETIEIDLNKNGTYKISVKRCDGTCKTINDHRKCLCFLICFIDLYLFKEINLAYVANKAEKKWDESIQLTYTKNLGEKIIKIVKEGLEENENKLNKIQEENKRKLF